MYEAFLAGGKLYGIKLVFNALLKKFLALIKSQSHRFAFSFIIFSTVGQPDCCEV